MNRLALPARASAVAVLALAALTLSGCTTSSSLTTTYAKHVNENYTSADGTIHVFAPGKRKPAVTYSAKTDAGTRVSSTANKGKVVVINFWYAGCPPCRTESSTLAALAKKNQAKGVVFFGVNVEDEAATARNFEKTHGIPYASVMDIADNSVQLAFAKAAALSATPTTLIIDKEGRVAAVFSGSITSPAVVQSVIDENLGEEN